MSDIPLTADVAEVDRDFGLLHQERHGSATTRACESYGALVVLACGTRVWSAL